MAPALPFRSYALTIRPRDGVTDAQVDHLLKWIKRVCSYYHLITEKTGSARHIHAGIILKEAKSRANVLNRLLNLFKELDTTEKAVLRKGLKVMYNWDWINEYLAKGDDTVVIESCLPEAGHIESYFPPKPVPQNTKRCSVYYHELEALWMKHTHPGTDVNTISVRNFLFKMMYSVRVIPVMRDDRQIIQTAKHLTRWLTSAEVSTIELAPFEKEE